MSIKMLKCPCGGTYMEGSDRHFKTKKHLDYLNYKDRYSQVITLLITEKFQCENRFEKSKTYLDKHLEAATDKNMGLKDMKNQLLKRQHMTTQN